MRRGSKKKEKRKVEKEGEKEGREVGRNFLHAARPTEPRGFCCL